MSASQHQGGFSSRSGAAPFVLPLPENGDRYYKILDIPESMALRSGLVVLQPGQDIGSHNTGKHEEMIIFLEGSGEIEIENGGLHVVGKGYIAYVPPATQHNVCNRGTGILRYLYIVTGVNGETEHSEAASL